MLSDRKGSSHNDRKQLLSSLVPQYRKKWAVCCGERKQAWPAHLLTPALDAPSTGVKEADLQEARALVPVGHCSEVFHVDLLTIQCAAKGFSTAESHRHGPRSENLGSAILKKGFF